MKLGTWVAALCLSASPVAAQQGINPPERTALLQLEQQWNDAIVERDAAALERILADDFMLIWIDGSISRKADMLSGLRTRRIEIDPFKTEEVEVRVYGDVAVVTGKFDQTVRLGERSETNSFRYTDVYRRSNGTWRAVSAHASRLPKPKPVDQAAGGQKGK